MECTNVSLIYQGKLVLGCTNIPVFAGKEKSGYRAVCMKYYVGVWFNLFNISGVALILIAICRVLNPACA
jgi:hypothetical protein